MPCLDHRGHPGQNRAYFRVVRKIAKRYKAVVAYKEFENHAHWVVAEPGWQEITEYIAGWLAQVL